MRRAKNLKDKSEGAVELDKTLDPTVIKSYSVRESEHEILRNISHAQKKPISRILLDAVKKQFPKEFK